MALSLRLPERLWEAHPWGPRDEDSYDVDPLIFNKSERLGSVVDFATRYGDDAADEKEKPTTERGGFHVVEKSGALKDTKRTQDAAAQPVFKPRNPNGPKKHQNHNAKHHTKNKGKDTRRGNDRNNGEVLRLPTIQLPEHVAVPVDLLPFSKGERGFATIATNPEFFIRGRGYVYDNAKDQITFGKTLRVELPKDAPVEIPKLRPLQFDKVIRQFAMQQNRKCIFVTDTILAALAASPKSKASWDASVIASDRMCLLYERDFEQDSFFQAPCRCDYEWVRETAAVGVTPLENAEGPNNATAMAEENMRLQTFLRDQAHTLTKKGAKLMETITGADKSEFETQSVLHYRSFTLKGVDDEEFTVVVRCELDGIQKRGDDKSYYRLFTLLEGPPSETVKPWKERADKQPGKLLTDELGLNAGKFARWAALSQLSGANTTKIAFASRVNATEPGRYDVVHVESMPTDAFARQVALPLRNMWTILAHIAHIIFQKRYTKCNIMKEPNKAKLFIFDRPAEGAAASSSSSSSSSSDSDSDSSDSSDSDSDSSDE